MNTPRVGNVAVGSAVCADSNPASVFAIKEAPSVELPAGKYDRSRRVSQSSLKGAPQFVGIPFTSDPVTQGTLRVDHQSKDIEVFSTAVCSRSGWQDGSAPK
jgi:hypothetical protein